MKGDGMGGYGVTDYVELFMKEGCTKEEATERVISAIDLELHDRICGLKQALETECHRHDSEELLAFRKELQQ